MQTCSAMLRLIAEREAFLNGAWLPGEPVLMQLEVSVESVPDSV